MRILAKPGFANQDTDPGNYNLYSAMSALGVNVEEWSTFSLLKGNFDLVHIHWPDNILKTRCWLCACLKWLLLVITCYWIRLILRRNIVWTAHNIVSHEQNHPKLEKLFWATLIRNLDGIIVHEKGISEKLGGLRPYTRKVKQRTIPLAHFKGSYSDEVNRSEARKELGISDSVKLFVFVGQIRPYKNVDALISAFKPGPDEWKLIIAGNPLDEQMSRGLNDMVQGDDRIDLRLGFVPDSKLQIYYRAADLAVLPFSQITNSGSALLALSFDCPVLMSKSPTLLSLKSEFGGDYVSFFEGTLQFHDLERTLKSISTAEYRQVDLSSRELDVVARDTLNFYYEVIAR